MLTILGGLAEFERSLIKARTDVGIKRRSVKRRQTEATAAHACCGNQEPR